ncbi:NAD(P)H-dependent glycerol-3-phosphate dehydrogenase [Testudinibacter aquarius]|uniref:Glycerol-3-phosphate dehydrogenase [NAD(P)+] n=1 Tax=Testudinibacter aquarius TaxID=1524974 RepID=A0A4R3XWX1_9PAST|nr:NAD(P)H-dependent glycerol-3-phosphate dehydrogenase [Testudinibacter aquarius]KAE9530994.1 glycerol-3-phosphate dehydrogenase [Testudinibacter aquarius]TCV83351.1 glycerol 3-phosphate dehydrogenase (NAD(P)+) [Testudinibacter aquarius]TNG91189.1 NAD(P)H-dependent glycerol-3-phosphate dehydrogenase [Testudinibacter aquarius]
MTTALTNTPITVLGAGSFGTSLAIAFSRNGYPTYLWGHDQHHLQRLADERQNNQFLPDITFPDSLIIEPSLRKAIQASRDILLVVPSHVFGDVIAQIKPLLRDDSRLIWATKGLERDSGRLLQTVIKEQLGSHYPLAVLSGPTFAKELANGLPTAIALASDNLQFAREVQTRIHCSKNFRVYINNDMIGVQLGGAVKNVIAIGAGISDGMGFGANARTALITRGIAEITRLGLSLGAQPETFMGMAGLGDLVLTCTDNQSRNRRFGLMLGQGFSAQQALDNIGQVVEGFYNTKEAHLLAQRQGIEMPITEQIYQVLFCGKDARDAALALLGRERKEEYSKE